MATLPEEIVEEILSKLPAKSLVRFNSVCKHWLSLISDSKFARKHLNNVLLDPSNHHRKLVLKSNTCFSFQSWDAVNARASRPNFPLRAPHVDLIGSINGLLCIGLGLGFSDREVSIVLWNPLLKGCNRLPNSDSDPFLLPPELHMGVGFGYDSSVDDYKVVKVLRHENVVEMYRVEIYTLKTNTWKTILLSKVPDGVNYGQPYKGTHVNGSIYWVVYQYVGTWHVQSIMCFDLIDEKLKFLELPPNDSGKPLITHLMDVRGVLGVLHGSYSIPKVHLWTMKEDNGKIFWSQKMVIRFPTKMFKVPVSFMKNGEVLMNCKTSWENEDLLTIYNPEEKTFHEDLLTIYNPEKKTFRNFFCYDQNIWAIEETSYIETLISPYCS